MRKIYFTIVLIALFLSACNYTDLGGMFVVGESVNERFEQSMAWNAQNPQQNVVVATDNYKLYIAADFHVGKTKNLEKFIAKGQTDGADALVFVGDIANGNDYDFENIAAVLPNKQLMPWYMMAGNHELYFGGWKHYHKHFGSSSYYFAVETPAANDLYICVDTGSGTMGSKQLKWLKNLLETERSKYRYCVIFTHNNLFRVRRTGSTNPVVEELHVFADLFARHNVAYVITGHDHLRNVFKFGKTTHVTMDAIYDDFFAPSFFVLELKNAVLKHEFIGLNE
jgi:predicted phosphodiesterase